jgi:hypothetical protein
MDTRVTDNGSWMYVDTRVTVMGAGYIWTHVSQIMGAVLRYVIAIAPQILCRSH